MKKYKLKYIATAVIIIVLTLSCLVDCLTEIINK